MPIKPNNSLTTSSVPNTEQGLVLPEAPAIARVSLSPTHSTAGPSVRLSPLPPLPPNAQQNPIAAQQSNAQTRLRRAASAADLLADNIIIQQPQRAAPMLMADAAQQLIRQTGLRRAASAADLFAATIITQPLRPATPILSMTDTAQQPATRTLTRRSSLAEIASTFVTTAADVANIFAESFSIECFGERARVPSDDGTELNFLESATSEIEYIEMLEHLGSLTKGKILTAASESISELKGYAKSMREDTVEFLKTNSLYESMELQPDTNPTDKSIDKIPTTANEKLFELLIRRCPELDERIEGWKATGEMSESEIIDQLKEKHPDETNAVINELRYDFRRAGCVRFTFIESPHVDKGKALGLVPIEQLFGTYEAPPSGSIMFDAHWVPAVPGKATSLVVKIEGPPIILTSQLGGCRATIATNPGNEAEVALLHIHAFANTSGLPDNAAGKEAREKEGLEKLPFLSPRIRKISQTSDHEKTAHQYGGEKGIGEGVNVVLLRDKDSAKWNTYVQHTVVEEKNLIPNQTYTGVEKLGLFKSDSGVTELGRANDSPQKELLEIEWLDNTALAQMREEFASMQA